LAVLVFSRRWGGVFEEGRMLEAFGVFFFFCFVRLFEGVRIWVWMGELREGRVRKQ